MSDTIENKVTEDDSQELVMEVFGVINKLIAENKVSVDSLVNLSASILIEAFEYMKLPETKVQTFQSFADYIYKYLKENGV